MKQTLHDTSKIFQKLIKDNIVFTLEILIYIIILKEKILKSMKKQKEKKNKFMIYSLITE